MEAATIETKASNDQAWNAVNHSFYLVVEVSIFSLSLSPMYVVPMQLALGPLLLPSLSICIIAYLLKELAAYET